MKNCFLLLSHLKIHIILFLDRLRHGLVHSTGNLSSRFNSGCSLVRCCVYSSVESDVETNEL